jgi:hypothetical protein
MGIGAQKIDTIVSHPARRGRAATDMVAAIALRSFSMLPRRSNTGDKLRSGARVHSDRAGTWRHLSSPCGCRHELRQLHPLVLRPRPLAFVRLAITAPSARFRRNTDQVSSTLTKPKGRRPTFSATAQTVLRFISRPAAVEPF